jgi:hypothetical protein
MGSRVALRIFLMESLILAQNERWRRGLGMQVGRVQQCTSGDLVSTSWVTCPKVGNNLSKEGLIPHVVIVASAVVTKAVMRFRMGPMTIS